MASDTNFTGKQIGNYCIISELDNGSFGRVYLGKHVIFESLVAIKLLHTHLVSPQQRSMFIDEARLLNQLEHPHILRIFDAGFQDNIPYIVMAYAARGSLRDYLKRQTGRPLSIDEALAILSSIGNALHFAHQQNIVHRDLKPENILFNSEGEAFLADFGIAVILSSAQTQMVGTGGTPSYMAPEQFQGIVSKKSDQYALGCIAYELMTGKRPFKVEVGNIGAMWYQHAQVTPPSPMSINPLIPLYVEQAIFKAIAKDRRDRYEDVQTFIAALEKRNIEERWLIKSNNYIDLARYEEALVALEQAISLDPDNPHLYSQKGYVLNNLERYEEALLSLEQAIQLSPRDPYLYGQKGYALNSLARYEEALETLELGISWDSTDPYLYNQKGYALNKLQHYEEALQALDIARQLAGSH